MSERRVEASVLSAGLARPGAAQGQACYRRGSPGRARRRGTRVIGGAHLAQRGVEAGRYRRGPPAERHRGKALSVGLN